MFMTITSWTECLEAECNFFDIKAFEVNYNIRHSMHHIHQIHHDINPSWMNDTQAWMDAIHFYSSNLYFNLLPNNWTWVPSQASLSSSSIRIFLCFIFISNISYFHFHSNIFIYIHHIHPYYVFHGWNVNYYLTLKVVLCFGWHSTNPLCHQSIMVELHLNMDGCHPLCENENHSSVKWNHMFPSWMDVIHP